MPILYLRLVLESFEFLSCFSRFFFLLANRSMCFGVCVCALCRWLGAKIPSAQHNNYLFHSASSIEMKPSTHTLTLKTLVIHAMVSCGRWKSKKLYSLATSHGEREKGRGEYSEKERQAKLCLHVCVCARERYSSRFKY